MPHFPIVTFPQCGPERSSNKISDVYGIDVRVLTYIVPNLINIIKKFEIQIHTLVCFTETDIKICLLVIKIVLFKKYN